jgi:hypothetical protein
VYSMGRPLISGPGGETLPARFPFAPLGFGSLRPRVLASRSALALASPQSCFCVHRGDASLFQRFMVRLFRTPPVFPSVRVHRIYFDILVPGPPTVLPFWVLAVHVLFWPLRHTVRFRCLSMFRPIDLSLT